LAGIVDDADLADSDLLVDSQRSCYDKLSGKDVKKAKTPKRSPLFVKDRIARRHPVRVEGRRTDPALLRLAERTMLPRERQATEP
jgi:hypothetical protein